MTRESVINEVVDDLTTELKNDVDFNADVLAVKVKNNYREIVNRKCYEYSSIKDDEDMIANDIYKRHYHILVNASRYDYNQIGVEGETSHSENGISRHYMERERIFADIAPYVKVL